MFVSLLHVKSHYQLWYLATHKILSYNGLDDKNFKMYMFIKNVLNSKTVRDRAKGTEMWDHMGYNGYKDDNILKFAL